MIKSTTCESAITFADNTNISDRTNAISISNNSNLPTDSPSHLTEWFYILSWVSLDTWVDTLLPYCHLASLSLLLQNNPH